VYKISPPVFAARSKMSRTFRAVFAMEVGVQDYAPMQTEGEQALAIGSAD